MSAIAGIRRLDGGPADPDLLALMTGAMVRRGPDGEGRWVEGPVGLGHRLLHTTPESLGEKQPVADDRGECRLVWDGRLDNRDELLTALGGGADRSDPELALEAYRRWGDAFLARLVGDFALAVWDRRARRLVCARDPIGVKPLYYRLDARGLAFASGIAALLADPAVTARPDESMVADFLLMDFRDHARTFFDGIKQLPPGHLLAVDERGLAVRRYRDVGGGCQPGRARGEEYLDGFREVLREAVRCRLRSHAPLGVLLSGGIDSTAVTAMAESIRRAEPHPALLAATLLHDEFLAEERDAIRALEREYGTPVHAVAPEVDGRRLTSFELFLDYSEALHHDAFLTMPLLTRPLAERGCRALLTGFGSDELIGSAETGYLADLLRSLRLGAFWRSVGRMAEGYGARRPGHVADLAWRQAPVWLRRLIKRGAGRDVPRWLDPAFARRAGVADRAAPEPARRFPTLTQEFAYRTVTAPTLALALTWMDARASEESLECRHPYLDRRVVEFFLSVPAPETVCYGYRKMFLQEAMRPVSRAPLRPVESTEVVVGSMARETWGLRDAERLREVLFRPGALVFDYVDRREAERIRDRYLAGEERCRNLLWQFGKLELWLREFIEGRR